MQAGNGGPVGAIDLESREIIPPNPYAVGAVDLRDDAAFEFEGRVRGILPVPLVSYSWNH